jgi:taurine dioxygenase
MNFDSVALHPSVGSEIRGVDLSQPQDTDSISRIKALLDDRALLLFRDQRLSPAQFARFSRAFGELRIHDLAKFRVPEQPEVTVLSNILDDKGEQIGFVDVGHVWHTDASFLEKPHMYSFLHSVEIPTHNGQSIGSTWFVSSADAYDSLTPEMKARISELKAIHRFDNRYAKHKEKTGQEASRDTFKDRAALPDVVHPVVRTHPATGRKSLYINELATAGIIGMADDEARELISTLCQHCARESQIYRHQWQVGDVLIWDNCTAQHVAIGDYKLPQRRFLYKTTVQGTIPF